MALPPTRIDSTPARLSTNMSIERQTPKRDFGDRMKAGLETAGGVLANGANIVGGFVPGGSILSAAVSSVSQLGGHSTPGSVGQAYSATGVVNIGSGNGGVNTTIGSGGSNPAGNLPGFGSTVGGQPNSLGSTGGSSGGQVGSMNNELVNASSENAKLLQTQIAMQRENQVFTSVSNVLKTRHDTVKNSIGNIR